MTISITVGFIEWCTTDAIVNPANEGLRRGGGACGDIFDTVEMAGGVDRLVAACRAIGHCPTGSAVTTESFGLLASHIIHAVGPKWTGGNRKTITTPDLTDSERNDLLLLKSTYEAILGQCLANGLGSVSIPAVSTGIYGVPKELGAAVAHAVCNSQSGIAVTLVAYGRDPRPRWVNHRTLVEAPHSASTAALRQAGII